MTKDYTLPTIKQTIILYKSYNFSIKLSNYMLGKNGEFKYISNLNILRLQKELEGKCFPYIKIGSKEHLEINQIINKYLNKYEN